MKSNFLILIFLVSFSLTGDDVTEYKAKYQFDSDEISITGIREFRKTNDAYELKFKASNFIVSMFFSSVFEIEDTGIKSLKYDINIKPKFLKRDQSIDFNYQNQEVISSGKNTWKSKFNSNEVTVDPLNAQIMIRKNLKHSLNSFSLKKYFLNYLSFCS